MPGTVAEKVPEAVMVDEAHRQFLERALRIPEIAEAKRKAEEALKSLHYLPQPQLICEGVWEGWAMQVTLRFSIYFGADKLLIERMRTTEQEVRSAFLSVGLALFRDTIGAYETKPGEMAMTFLVLDGEVSEKMEFFKQLPYM